MNTTKHVALLTSNIFGRGFDSRRLHQFTNRLQDRPYFAPLAVAHTHPSAVVFLFNTRRKDV
jgi:hypothetical protein